MLAALLLAVCSWPLDYGLVGQACEQPTDPCRCSQAIQWDRNTFATASEIWRHEVGGVWIMVGDVPIVCTQFMPSTVPGEADICQWREPQAWWLPIWDQTMPHEGVTYEYTVVHVNDCGRSELDPAVSVQYTGPPVACFELGREVACYEGDPLMRPAEVAPAKRSWWRRLFGLRAKSAG